MFWTKDPPIPNCLITGKIEDERKEEDNNRITGIRNLTKETNSQELMLDTTENSSKLIDKERPASQAYSPESKKVFDKNSPKQKWIN